MKNLIAIIVLFLCSVPSLVRSQEPYATYHNSYFASDPEPKEIQVHSKEGQKYDLYINMTSLDKLHKEGGVTIKEKQHSAFLEKLGEAKVKYEEWVKTAKENNVQELDKEMAIKSNVGSFFQYGSKWNFQFSVNLTFSFKIIDGSKYLLIVRTGKLTSSSNQFMTHDGFVFVFSSPEEIDEFMSILSVEKAKEFAAKPKAETLFKD